MSKRELKKQVMAEALALYRVSQAGFGFPVKSVILSVPDGALVRTHYLGEFGYMDELLNACARLAGRIK